MSMKMVSEEREGSEGHGSRWLGWWGQVFIGLPSFLCSLSVLRGWLLGHVRSKTRCYLLLAASPTWKVGCAHRWSFWCRKNVWLAARGDVSLHSGWTGKRSLSCLAGLATCPNLVRQKAVSNWRVLAAPWMNVMATWVPRRWLKLKKSLSLILASGMRGGPTSSCGWRRLSLRSSHI